ncbi:hypothetical protein NQ315_008803 [Exocentrus adspersus]|uniref:Uncharacterized protein n=1 Tax=Exocentrus adspersus TaxID=1586481 RepID=A0AAV8VGZ8_9CUCU|nr:hypothetical protein NQ315_008803 [Exocentrus adspersus]
MDLKPHQMLHPAQTLNRLNLEFQSEKPKLHLLLKRSSDLYRSILRNYITQEVQSKNFFYRLKKYPYFGAKVEVLIKTYCDRNPQGSIEIKNFKICALDFYDKKRFKFDEPSLKFISEVLDPQLVISGNIPSIVLGAQQYFPNLILNNDIEKLNSESRLLQT